MNNYIKPCSDVFIKYLFSSIGNEYLLLSFINDVLIDSKFKTIKNVFIKNPFNLEEFKKQKPSIIDIKATDEQGKIFNIEIQIIKQKFFPNRSVFYTTKIYSTQLKKGDSYKELKPVIGINIVDFILFKEIKKIHSVFFLTEKDNPELILTDHLQIHFLELLKIKKIDKLKNHLHKWLFYFKFKGIEEDKMKILIKDDPIIKKVDEAYERFISEDIIKKINEEEGERIRITEIEEAREEGIEEGIKKGIKKGLKKGIEEGIEKGKIEGIEKGKIEDARKMLLKNLDIHFISEITGLSIDKIKKL